MKKLFAVLLALAMLLGCAGLASAEDKVGADEALIAAAKEEGTLTVYGSCEENYLNAACDHFEELYGIKVERQRKSTNEVPGMISEELGGNLAGSPSADIWFGGTNGPYDEAIPTGILDNSYVPANASHLTRDMYKNPDGYWYGIYTGILGIMVNKDELARKELPVPETWDDLLKPEYKDLIWLSNYKTAGTARTFVNLILQMKGQEDGIKYLVDLDKNIQVYTKSGSGPSKNVGIGQCTIGIGFLHDGISQILDQGYDNIQLIIPKDGTTCEIGPVAIFKNAKHPNAAKLFMEYALSPECVELAAQNESYQFLVLDNAKQPEAAAEFGLDLSAVWEGYDFAKAAAEGKANVELVMEALGEAADDRFQTE